MTAGAGLWPSVFLDFRGHACPAEWWKQQQKRELQREGMTMPTGNEREDTTETAFEQAFEAVRSQREPAPETLDYQTIRRRNRQTLDEVDETLREQTGRG